MTNSSNGDPGISSVLPRVLATSLITDWNTNGVDSLVNRNTGTIGSLGEGQWNWGNNDSLGYSTIYYRLASGQTDITTVHIEGGEDSAQRRNPILVSWSYIYIKNFKVLFSNHSGVLNQTASNYNTYDNIDSSYTGRSGLSIGIFNHLTVTNSRFDHNGLLLIGDTTGIQLSGTTYCTIKNNIVSNGAADSGINVKTGSDNNTIENNIIFNNLQHGIDISATSIDNIVYNNTIYNNGSAGINIEAASTGNLIKNNIMANNQGYQLSVTDTSTTGLVSNYNSFYFTNQATTIIRYISNYYSSNSFSTYQSASGQDANSYITNPDFRNTSGTFSLVGDFRLLRTSPLINVGASVGITTDYANTAVPQSVVPDIGAYEYIPLTVTVNQAVGQSDPTNSSTANFTAIFSESVSDFATGDVTLSGTAGATTATVTGSGTTYNVAATGMTGSGTIIASIAAGVATGATGNTNAISTSTNNIVTYDIVVPIISLVSSGTPTSNGAIITWTTNEDSSSKVDYGLTNSYGISTVEADTLVRVSSHSVNISSLLACTVYHYRVRSTDSAANEKVDSDNIFTTSGCSVSSDTSSISNTGLSNPGSPVSCSSLKPTSVPDLFQINVIGTSAMVFFTPIEDINKYYISYSTNSLAEGHGIEVVLGKIGAQNYTINLLKPNTTYYFKIRGQRDCVPGNWSNILMARVGKKTGTKIATPFFKNIILPKLFSQFSAKKLPTLLPITKPVLQNTNVENKNGPKIAQKKCYLWGWICF